MKPRIFVNGQEASSISVFDRGFQFGDGVFETMAGIDGRLCQRDKHLNRLKHGLTLLGIAPVSLDAELKQAEELLCESGDAVVKLIVSRGESLRGYRPASETHATIVLQVFPHQFNKRVDDLPSVRLGLCQTPLSINSLTAGLKHLNRLDQVLASQECQHSGFDDGLMMAGQSVVESTSSNLFLVTEEGLLTPTLRVAGIAGTARACVIEVAQSLSIPVFECEISPDQCHNAKAMFLTNAIAGIRPVSSFEKTSYSPKNWPLSLFEKSLKHVYS